jgi:hypothetical protein
VGDYPNRQLVVYEKDLVGWLSGIGPRIVAIALADDIYKLGVGSTLAEGFKDW